jgi:C-terminal processing protease CtpA/Prc
VAGDELVSVDEALVQSLSHIELVRKVRGPPGSSVMLGLRRPSTTDDHAPGNIRLVELQRQKAETVLHCASAFGRRSVDHGDGGRRRRSFLIL